MRESTPPEPRRVLLVDDEPAFTRMVKRNLEAAGNYAVKAINESLSAYTEACSFHPDIILLDVVMPQADGGDVATQLRNHPKTQHIPIIFVSAMVSRKESGEGFYESGGEHFIAKPVTTELLIHAIDQILGPQINA